MPDFILYYPTTQSYGTIESSIGTVVTITQDSFSPGLWADAENMNICINAKIYCIHLVSIDGRMLIVDRPPDATYGDLIFHASILNRSLDEPV